MISYKKLEDFILYYDYSDVVTIDDINKIMQESLPVVQKLAASGKPWGILTDCRNLKEFTPDAMQFFAGLLGQYKNVKQSINAIIFKDRHNPTLKYLQETLIKEQLSFSNYFTDYDRALQFLKERLVQLVNE